MGFDPETEGQPLVDVKKRTTKVNLAVVVGVLIFFAIAAAVLIKYARSPGETRDEMHEEKVEP